MSADKEGIAEDQIDSDNSICPYCKHESHVESEDYSEDERVEECEECGNKFYLYQVFSVDHRTTGDCELNGEKHDYQPTPLGGGKFYPFCSKCNKCQPHAELKSH